jgi:eukaryotic-like serine/threonine-protein kinase
MAEVWEAHDENLDRAVAVKMLHGHLSGDAGFVSRFRREALSIAKLSHQNVVAIFDTGVEQLAANSARPSTTRAYIVMELIRGESLRAILQRGVSVGKAVDIIRQAADGLAYAHRNGLVHRDVKPANILVQADGRVKVVDFGIAKLTGRQTDDTEGTIASNFASQPGEDLTQVGAILGTAKYLAPEQVEGGTIDARSDIYALGVVLYECVCGRPPFTGANDLATALKHVHERPAPPRQVRPGIPRGLEFVILKAMTRDPNGRYSSADELSIALRTIDLTPDDAVPSVSRTANDVTPANGIERERTAQSSASSSKSAVGSNTDARPTPEPRSSVRLRSPIRGDIIGDVTTISNQPQVTASSDVVSDGPNNVGVGVAKRKRFAPLAAIVGLMLGGGAGLAASSITTSLRTGKVIPVQRATAYDPEENGAENDALAKNTIDGKISTEWHTLGYDNQNFGDKKTGVGIIIRLKDLSQVGHLQIISPSRGWSARVYAMSDTPDSFPGWGQPISKAFKVDQATSIIPLRKTNAGVLLLWITQLGSKSPTQQKARVIVQELSVRG